MIETVQEQAPPATEMSAEATVLQNGGADMPEEIGLFEAMRTQRAIRHFKPAPVPDELITKIL
ncbi:MAG: hypothetical protein J4F46_07560 [Dehalococcoidia bacterium]|nr:hypothetical protein [Dehalococcoidia bacterium]